MIRPTAPLEWDSHRLSNYLGAIILSTLLGIIGLPTMWAKYLPLNPKTLTFPPGPLSFLGNLSQTQLDFLAHALPIIYVAGLIGFALPFRRTKILFGILAGIAAIFALSLRTAHGKIDHTLIIHVLPLLVALDNLRNKQDLFFVRTALGFFFLNSFASKLLGGWAHWDSFAVLGWLKQYQVEYGLGVQAAGLFHRFAQIGIPTFPKFMDIIALGVEGLFSLLFFTRRSERQTSLLLLLLSLFHISIYQLFNFRFALLSVPYWWMSKPSVESKKSLSWLWLLSGLSIVLALVFFPEGIYPLLMVYALLYGFLAVERAPENTFRIRHSLGATLWLLTHAILLGVSLFHREVYPHLGGPRFQLNADLQCTCSFELKQGPNQRDPLLDALTLRKVKQFLILKKRGTDPSFSCLSHGFLPHKNTETFLKAMEGRLQDLKISAEVHQHCPPPPKAFNRASQATGAPSQT